MKRLPFGRPFHFVFIYLILIFKEMELKLETRKNQIVSAFKKKKLKSNRFV